MGRPSRYLPEFRREAVELVKASDRSRGGDRAVAGDQRQHQVLIQETNPGPSGGPAVTRWTGARTATQVTAPDGTGWTFGNASQAVGRRFESCRGHRVSAGQAVSGPSFRCRGATTARAARPRVVSQCRTAWWHGESRGYRSPALPRRTMQPPVPPGRGWSRSPSASSSWRCRRWGPSRQAPRRPPGPARSTRRTSGSRSGGHGRSLTGFDHAEPDRRPAGHARGAVAPNSRRLRDRRVVQRADHPARLHVHVGPPCPYPRRRRPAGSSPASSSFRSATAAGGGAAWSPTTSPSPR